MIIRERVAKYVVLSHENADIDAVASVMTMRRLLSLYIDRGDIITPQFSMSKIARRVLDKLGLSIEFGDVCSQDYVLVLLDMSDPDRFVSGDLRRICTGARAVYAIDHHRSSAPNDIRLLYMPYAATTEIILEIAEGLGVVDKVLDVPEIRKLAMLAIVTDTAFFSSVGPRTFHFMDLLSKGINFPEVVKILRDEGRGDVSRKMAMLKSLQRLMVQKVGEFIVVVTHVGSFESDVANALLQLGADVAVVVSKKKSEKGKHYRIILRSKEHDMEGLLAKLCREYGGNYGVINGRVGGAQIPIRIKLDKLKKRILEETVSWLSTLHYNHGQKYC